jgi:MoaA/NifB/PqqE/SkfB family radical SAM enzyme
MNNKLHPQAIFIQLLTHCNAECINCPFEFTYNSIHKNGKMSDETWIKILSDIIEMEFEGQVGFYLHHEPLLDKTLFDKIKDINEKTKAHVVLSTNGQLLTEININKMIDAKPRKVHLNINSGNKVEYESSMKGLKYETTINNCKNFIKKAKDIIEIEVNCPIIEGFDVASLEKIFPEVKVHLDYWANSRGGLLPDFYRENKGSRFKVDNYCKQPTQNFNILYDGSTIACCMDWMHESKKDFLNVKNSSILEIYYKINNLEEAFKNGDYSKYKMCNMCSKELGFYRKEKHKLKILLTNHHLTGYTGSEILTLTLAQYLKFNGHNVVVYSKYLNKIVNEFADFDIKVVDNLEEIKYEKFDIAHIHHNISLLEVRNTFPLLPIVFLSQGVIPFLEQPPLIDLAISKYLAISEEVKLNLMDYGISDSNIEVIGNLVKTESFKVKNKINPSPKNVLVISGKIDDGKVEIINKACSKLNLNVEYIGGRFGEFNQQTVVNKIEASDIIITLGRGAIESMIAGRSVIVYDYQGADGMITNESYDEIKKHNFSGRRYGKDYNVDDLVKEIQKYNIDDIFEVQKKAINDFSADKVTSKIISIYNNILASNETPSISKENLAQTNYINYVIQETFSQAYVSGVRYQQFEKNNSSNLILIAEELINENNISIAIKVLNEILLNEPESIDALNDLAVCNIMEGKHQFALNNLLKVLTIEATNEIALENLEFLENLLAGKENKLNEKLEEANHIHE